MRQETTMAKSGTLTHYLYTSSIENIVDSTELEDAKLINFEENIQERKNLMQLAKKNNVVDSIEEDFEQSDSFSSSDDEFDGVWEPLDTSNQTNELCGSLNLNKESLFLVGRNSKFGRSIKVNSNDRNFKISVVDIRVQFYYCNLLSLRCSNISQNDIIQFVEPGSYPFLLRELNFICLISGSGFDLFFGRDSGI